MASIPLRWLLLLCVRNLRLRIEGRMGRKFDSRASALIDQAIDLDERVRAWRP